MNSASANLSSAALAPDRRAAIDGDVFAAAGGSRAPSTPRLRSDDLFGARREIEIEHAGAIYRLRLTSLGKLLLTK
jgi:hypothetical protein